jgi:hypothetical protein
MARIITYTCDGCGKDLIDDMGYYELKVNKQELMLCKTCNNILTDHIFIKLRELGSTLSRRIN